MRLRDFPRVAGRAIERASDRLRRSERHSGSGLAPLDLLAQAEGQLHALLLAEGITPRAVYRPGEVCQLLRIRPTTLRQFCELAEHPAVKNADPRDLDAFLVGCHHRISHPALVEWLVRNQKFQREG
ncbi:hypothetical protein [Candidatus Contendibacter odensensis]|nr:hypothetical protein [Candidatus Contendobacter odensis]